MWGCEDSAIAKTWRDYFDSRIRKDERPKNNVSPKVVDNADNEFFEIRPSRNVILRNASDGSIFGVIIYDFLYGPRHFSVLWSLDNTLKKLGGMSRNARVRSVISGSSACR